MKRKYIIARNEKERECNLKYITKIYNLNQKKNESFLQYLICLFLSLRLMEPYYWFSKELCELYIKEIKLYYLNNSFSPMSLQIRKAYLIKKNEQHYSIVLPIFLSLIASIIYGIFSDNFLIPITKNIILPFGKKFLEFLNLIMRRISVISHVSDILSIIVQFMILFAVIIIMILSMIWIIIKVVFLVSALFGGFNFSKNTIKQYEIDYLEKLISCDNYVNVLDSLDTYEEEFFDIINSLVYNIVIRENFSTIENLETKLVEELLKNPIIDIIDKEKIPLDLFDKELIVKSIICRSLLKINEKSSNLVLKGSKVFLKHL